MSADVPFLVKVLKLIEGKYVVYAVTEEDAIAAVSKVSSVAKVVEARLLLETEDGYDELEEEE